MMLDALMTAYASLPFFKPSDLTEVLVMMETSWNRHFGVDGSFDDLQDLPLQ
jgi:hypothetical protein